MKANDFQEWLKTTPEYQTLVFQHGERLFIQRDGEFENLTVRLAYRAWSTQQVNIDQLNNVLDERTKEWLQAIECGSYFENVAKPLKQQYDDIKTQLNNMEACYIEKKKQVEAVNAVLMNWQDEYTEYTHQHECTVDAVLRTCIAELEQALRGASD